MGCSDRAANAQPVTLTDRESISKEECDVTGGDSAHGCSSSSVHSSNGIVSMYRGISNTDLWMSTGNSTSIDGVGGGEFPTDSTGRSHGPTCLPPVFALTRTSRSVLSVQQRDATRPQSSGQSTKPVGDATTSETLEPGQDCGERTGDRDVSSLEDAHEWKVTSLSAAWDNRYSSDTYIVCVDTSSSSTALGWGMRNVLALLAAHLPVVKNTSCDRKGDKKERGNASSSDTSSVTNTEFSPESSPRVSCNIIALRGALAKRLHKCASREKAMSLLDTLTDLQIGQSGYQHCSILSYPVLFP